MDIIFFFILNKSCTNYKAVLYDFINTAEYYRTLLPRNCKAIQNSKKHINRQQSIN